LKQITSKTFNEALITKLNEIFTDIYRKLGRFANKPILIVSPVMGSSKGPYFDGFRGNVKAVTNCQRFEILEEGTVRIWKIPYVFMNTKNGWMCLSPNPPRRLTDANGEVASIELLSAGYYSILESYPVYGDVMVFYPVTETYNIIQEEV